MYVILFWMYSKCHLGKKKDNRMKTYLIEKHEMKEIRTRYGILGHQFDKRIESLLHAIHIPFYCRGFDRKPYSTLVLKITYKKIRETRKLESVHEWHFVERKN